ncbi:MAG: hypothetical protein RI953_1524 [Pseudomonadota bacterium]|jgi:hypothetical protein
MSFLRDIVSSMIFVFSALLKMRLLSRVGYSVALFFLLFSQYAKASDFEVLKQKKCNLLIAPSDGLRVGESFQAQSSSGRNLNLRVTKKSKRNAIVTISSKGGKCPKVSGSISSTSVAGGNKKFYFGVMLNAGLYTFKQPFAPVAASENDTTPQPINGLSGIGYSGGALLRFMPTSSLGIETGFSALSSTTSGKTVIGNNDDYIVTAKFTELVIQPALSITKCISTRLYCKLGGIFGIPLSAKLSITSTDLALETNLNYKRFGGEFAAGLNLGSAFTLAGGAQITSVKGSFSFPPDGEVVSLSPLTVYIFGGIVSAF